MIAQRPNHKKVKAPVFGLTKYICTIIASAAFSLVVINEQTKGGRREFTRREAAKKKKTHGKTSRGVFPQNTKANGNQRCDRWCGSILVPSGSSDRTSSVVVCRSGLTGQSSLKPYISCQVTPPLPSYNTYKVTFTKYLMKTVPTYLVGISSKSNFPLFFSPASQHGEGWIYRSTNSPEISQICERRNSAATSNICNAGEISLGGGRGHALSVVAPLAHTKHIDAATKTKITRHLNNTQTRTHRQNEHGIHDYSARITWTMLHCMHIHLALNSNKPCEYNIVASVCVCDQDITFQVFFFLF